MLPLPRFVLDEGDLIMRQKNVGVVHVKGRYCYLKFPRRSKSSILLLLLSGEILAKKSQQFLSSGKVSRGARHQALTLGLSQYLVLLCLPFGFFFLLVILNSFLDSIICLSVHVVKEPSCCTKSSLVIVCLTFI